MKTKNKIYVKDSYYERKPFKVAVVEYLLNVIVYAFILVLSANLFKGIYIENIWYAILASIIINLFNITIKPMLVLVTLPVTISTFGLFYPVINLIVLKLTYIVMEPHFVIKGFLVPLIVVIFISVLKIFFEFSIIKPIVERRSK